MIRLLFWVALILLAVWAWRKFKSPALNRRRPGSEKALPMVRCAQCGLHLPDSRALRQGELWYCSQAHLEQGPGTSAR
jgi:uncharacterized protein